MTGPRYRIQWRRGAVDFLNKLRDAKLKARLYATIERLSHEPYPVGAKKLAGRAEYRVRVGAYRILYAVDGRAIVVEVIAIGHRKEIYR
jgi:mRNA interferase RelE/StbE